jgi:hypothetical protein
MAVIEENDTKRQIIEKLDSVPADKLASVLDFVDFISLRGEDWVLDPAPLTDRERELVQEALDDPRPDIPHSEVVKMLGL